MKNTDFTDFTDFFSGRLSTFAPLHGFFQWTHRLVQNRLLLIPLCDSVTSPCNSVFRSFIRMRRSFKRVKAPLICEICGLFLKEK